MIYRVRCGPAWITIYPNGIGLLEPVGQSLTSAWRQLSELKGLSAQCGVSVRDGVLEVRVLEARHGQNVWTWITNPYTRMSVFASMMNIRCLASTST